MKTPYCPDCSAALALQTLSQDETAPLFEDYSAAMVLQAMSSGSDAGSSCQDSKEVSDLALSVKNLKLNRPQSPIAYEPIEATELELDMEACSMQDYALRGTTLAKILEIRENPEDIRVRNALGMAGNAIQLWDIREDQRENMVADILYAFGVAELHEALHILECTGFSWMADYFY